MDPHDPVLIKESLDPHAYKMHRVNHYELPNIPFFDTVLETNHVGELEAYRNHGQKLLADLDLFLLSQKRTFNQNVFNLNLLNFLPESLKLMRFPEAL